MEPRYRGTVSYLSDPSVRHSTNSRRGETVTGRCTSSVREPARTSSSTPWLVDTYVAGLGPNDLARVTSCRGALPGQPRREREKAQAGLKSIAVIMLQRLIPAADTVDVSSFSAPHWKMCCCCYTTGVAANRASSSPNEYLKFHPLPLR